MLGLLIVAAAGASAGYFSYQAWGLGWGITCGIFSLLLAWVVLSLILRAAINRRQAAIQEIMQAAQNKINRQIEFFQRRQQSDMNGIRQTVEKIQFDAIRQSLAETEKFRGLYPWNPMLHRQINAMKLQLYYQLRDYAKVDELLPRALLLDVHSLAIKLVRMYRKEDAKLDKFFHLRCGRMKGENGAFIASVYAWIKIRQGDAGKALEALRRAEKSSDNPTLLENIDRLSNNKVKHFSNSGFGDMWYALALEEPKIKRQRPSMRGY